MSWSGSLGYPPVRLLGHSAPSRSGTRVLYTRQATKPRLQRAHLPRHGEYLEEARIRFYDVTSGECP